MFFSVKDGDLPLPGKLIVAHLIELAHIKTLACLSSRNPAETKGSQALESSGCHSSLFYLIAEHVLVLDTMQTNCDSILSSRLADSMQTHRQKNKQTKNNVCDDIKSKAIVHEMRYSNTSWRELAFVSSRQSRQREIIRVGKQHYVYDHGDLVSVRLYSTVRIYMT